jgi:hypothetical protein
MAPALTLAICPVVIGSSASCGSVLFCTSLRKTTDA